MPKIGGICMTYDFDTHEAIFYSIEANEVKTEVLGLAKKAQPEETEGKVAKFMASEYINSLELLDQINMFRMQEGSKPTKHRDLMIIIETEFTDINRKRVDGGVCPENHTLIIRDLEKEGISRSTYVHDQNQQEYPMYVLPINKAKQCLLKESKFVRKAVIAYIEKLETALQQASLPSYQINDPIQRAERWIEEQKSMKVLEDRVSEIEPLAKKYEQFFENESAISLRRAVKALNIKHGYTSVAAFLRAKKYLTKNNEPNQSMINRGIFMLKPASETKDCKCFVTIKGVEWLDNYLMEKSNQLKNKFKNTCKCGIFMLHLQCIKTKQHESNHLQRI